jgi:hypothetical protein
MWTMTPHFPSRTKALDVPEVSRAAVTSRGDHFKLCQSAVNQNGLGSARIPLNNGAGKRHETLNFRTIASANHC